MLKRYKLHYKKLQTRRAFNKCVVFFNTWAQRTSRLFRDTFYLFFYRTTLIKLKFVKKLKKRFRKPLRRKGLRLWFFCKPNYLVHQKFKNARMGKGKGSPVLWMYKPITNKPFAIISHVNEMRAKSIAAFFKLRLTPHILVRRW